MIIHISGTPGSGKTTLGEELQKIYGDKIIVYDTDEFIQHHNKAGKKLLAIDKSASIEEYMKIWKGILGREIDKFITKNKNKIIVFTGILNNFSPDDTIYEIEADYKFMLNVDIYILLKRYYMRLCNDEKQRAKEDSQDYWNKVSTQVYNINSSKEMINSNQKDIKWHKEHGYLLKNDKEIINEIGKILKNTKGGSKGYYNKYLKYKTKYITIKGGNNKNIIFITGKAASGKSSVSKKIEQDGYFLVSLDEIIKHELSLKMKNEIQTEFNGDYTYLYRLYRNDDNSPIISKARNIFIKIIKDIIMKHKKVVVEGSLWNIDAIRQIFGKDDEFTFYFVKPKNEEIYLERLKLRFMEDPNNYGRLGFLWKNDADGKALADYHKNGITGKLINNLITTVGKKEYDRVDEWIDRYKDEFLKMKMYIN